MPPQLAAFLQSRNNQIAVGAVALLLIVGIIFMAVKGGGSSDNDDNKKLDSKQLELVSVDSVGKAIEIQALLAKKGVRLDREAGDGGKQILKFNSKATEGDKDIALLTLVSSGMMDQNVGLALFDKGDLTASREEKRIKLNRAQKEELQRLIRRLGPVADAQVFLSIPEQTLFTAQKKPMSATVQITPKDPTMRIDSDVIRSIINLMVGSIPDLDSQHVAVTDTNGITYNSVLNEGAELGEKLRDQDAYMKQKVGSQLDKLVGQGNYVVTVSTLLRETVKETLHESYDPDKTAVASKQTFNENLNAKSSSSSSTVGGPVSSTISQTLAGGGDSSNNKGYERTGSEVSYRNTKTQWIETSNPGMIEDISVAVTIDKAHFPKSMSEMELKRLIANSASPKVDPYDVTIAQASFKDSDASSATGINSSVGGSGELELDTSLNWIPWAAGALIVCVLLILVMSMRSGQSSGISPEAAETQRELEELKSIAAQQRQELQATQQQTQMLMQQQQQQQLAQQQMAAISGGGSINAPQQDPLTSQLQSSPQGNQGVQLQEALDQIEDAVDDDNLDEDDLVLNLKHYIEES